MQEYIKKILGSCRHSSSSPLKTTTLVISNDEMKDLIEAVKSLEDSGLLFNQISDTSQNEAKEQKRGFLSMLLGTLGASLLGNILTGKGTTRAGEGAIRKKLMTNFEMQKYCQNQTIFNGVYSRDNLPKIKDGVYVTNLDECCGFGTHWIALYVLDNDVIYFDSFGVQHIPKKIKAFISNKNIKINIFRIQTYDSIMCGSFCIGFIDFMLPGNTLTGFKNLFSPNNFKKTMI